MFIDNWKMFYEGKELMCKAPCSMYSVLLDYNLIENPFWGLNEQSLTHLSDKNCTFIGEFLVDKKILDCNYIDIIFHGLDTICDVYLNETLLACVNDMHCAYTYDVKSSLVEGKNIVRLDFKSPTKYFAEKNRRNFLYTNMDTIPGAAHLRKALYMSGWDWGVSQS